MFWFILIFRASVASKELVSEKNPRTWEELGTSKFPESLKTMVNGQAFLRQVNFVLIFSTYLKGQMRSISLIINMFVVFGWTGKQEKVMFLCRFHGPVCENSEKQIMVFATDRGLSILETSRRMSCDGTFYRNDKFFEIIIYIF